MNIELTYDMQGMNNETKTYQTFTLLAETKRLANATTSLHVSYALQQYTTRCSRPLRSR